MVSWNLDRQNPPHALTSDGSAVIYVGSSAGPDGGVETTPVLRVVARQTLFSVNDYLPTTPHSSYDVSPDGKTFALVRRNAASRIVVIQNFPELVRRIGGAAGPQ